MDKEVKVHIHSGILLSYKKNAFELVLVRWINLELIILSEVSQKEKDKFCILTHTYGEGNGTPLQYSCLGNPMDGVAWWATVHGVARSRTRLTNFTFTFHFHALEKEMATHSSILAWRIPWTE